MNDSFVFQQMEWYMNYSSSQKEWFASNINLYVINNRTQKTNQMFKLRKCAGFFIPLPYMFCHQMESDFFFLKF